MRFSLNFIQEFLKVGLAPKELAKRLTMAGMEVEAFEKSGADWIFTVEVTSNRYDWLSIAGIAQEIAAVSAKELKIKAPEIKTKPLLLRKVIIADSRDCPYYIGRSLKGVKAAASSQKIKTLISNCGLSTVNNVVDITNYCMLKWGNPLHAFDEDKLEGDISVRRAKPGESFVGIDNKERFLDKANLVIADSKKIVALAGVIGSKNSEVDEKTKNIFLEAAIFSPITVRRSRRKAGIDTESSYRFERRVNPQYLQFASQEAAQLIEEIAGGTFSGAAQAGKLPKISPKKIAITLSSLADYLGCQIPEAQFKSILRSLGFNFRLVSKGKYFVFSPRQRFDIAREVDVYEEISRIYGYEKIPPRLPFLRKDIDAKLISRGKDVHSFNNELRNYLALMGFREIISYSIEAKDEVGPADSFSGIEIVNPLRQQENTLRPSLLSGMIKSITYNLNRSQAGLRFFELAHLYAKAEGGFYEFSALGLGISGKDQEFFLLKGVVEKILQYASSETFAFEPGSLPFFSDSLNIVFKGRSLGFIGKLNRQLRQRFDLKEDVFFAQLNLEELLKVSGEKTYKPISPYPAVWRDISLALSKEVNFKQVEETIKDRCKHLFDLRIIDVYRGKDLPPQTTAFTLRIFYQSADKTLTAQEVDMSHNQAREALSQLNGLKLR